MFNLFRRQQKSIVTQMQELPSVIRIKVITNHEYYEWRRRSEETK